MTIFVVNDNALNVYNCYSPKWPHGYSIWCFRNECVESHFAISGSQWNFAAWHFHTCLAMMHAFHNKNNYYIMDTDYQDLATATEVLNKAYQLKQVDEKWYWPLKSDIDRWKVILTAEKWHWPLGLRDVILHTSLFNMSRNLCFDCSLRWLIGDMSRQKYWYVKVSVVLSLTLIITFDMAM